MSLPFRAFIDPHQQQEQSVYIGANTKRPQSATVIVVKEEKKRRSSIPHSLVAISFHSPHSSLSFNLGGQHCGGLRPPGLDCHHSARVRLLVVFAASPRPTPTRIATQRTRPSQQRKARTERQSKRELEREGKEKDLAVRSCSGQRICGRASHNDQKHGPYQVHHSVACEHQPPTRRGPHATSSVAMLIITFRRSSHATVSSRLSAVKRCSSSLCPRGPPSVHPKEAKLRVRLSWH